MLKPHVGNLEKSHIQSLLGIQFFFFFVLGFLFFVVCFLGVFWPKHSAPSAGVQVHGATVSARDYGNFHLGCPGRLTLLF